MLRTSMMILSISILPALSGCAAIGQVFGQATNKPVAAYDSGDAGLNTAILERRMGFHAPMFRVHEDAQNRFNAPMDFRILPSEASAPKLRGLMPREAYENPVRHESFLTSQTVQSSPSNAQDVSYVKMGGGSDMADWQACETLAGGLFVIDTSGYEVDPQFDACMRARGYKTEREAQADLKVGWPH